MSSEISGSPVHMPGPVRFALGFMGVGFVVALVRAALMKDWSRPGEALIWLAVLVGVCAAWVYGLYRRKNWLRWFTILSFAVGIANTPWALDVLHDPRQIAMYWVQCFTALPAAVLLCLPTAARWFMRRAVP
jgi:hypothetical protein